MYIVKWLRGDSVGYDDHIPENWIKQSNPGRRLRHLILGPNHWCRIAECTVVTSGEVVTFDYAGPNKLWNQEQGLYIGKMKLTFESSDRLGIPMVSWKDEGKHKEFEADCGKVVLRSGLRTDIDFEEGGKRLASYHRRTRRHLRAKKLYSEFANGATIQCEVCKVDLTERYGAAGIAAYEVHHRRPLKEGFRKTRLEDLSIICANCHGVLHYEDPLPSVQSFARILKRRGRHISGFSDLVR